MVLDVAVTTGETNEGQMIVERIDATMAAMGLAVSTVTADAGYAMRKYSPLSSTATSMS